MRASVRSAHVGSPPQLVCGPVPGRAEVGGDEGSGVRRRAAPHPLRVPSSRVPAHDRASYDHRMRTIPELVRAAVDDAADKPWLHTHDVELTYAEMLARVERAASALRAFGVRRGDRVLTTPRNTADYL